MRQDAKDWIGGGLIFLLGVAVLIQSTHYGVGTLTQIGSGFFPAALGAFLAVVGALITLRAKAGPASALSDPESGRWRGWCCILLSIVAFAGFGYYGGLAPATFASVFVAALADRKNSVGSAFLLAVIMTIIAAVVFRWLLQVQFPLFQWGGR